MSFDLDSLTPGELAQYEAWRATDEINRDAVEAGVPVWQLVPLERLEGVLGADEIAAAQADPERLALSEVLAEEQGLPLLRALRERGAAVFEDANWRESLVDEGTPSE